jgi:hypothetical protein
MDAMVKTESVVPREIRDGTTSIKFDWWPQWQGQTVALIASGPSAKKSNIAALEGHTRVLAINESYQLCPFADALYACDAHWWRLKLGVPEFHGLKISQDREACKLYPDVKRVIVDRFSNSIQLEEPGKVGAGGNSGFQALNLAVQFGAKRIILVGYDMRVDLGEHWHKRHPMPLSNPHPNDNLPRWRAAIDGAAPTLKQLGIMVYNCSSVSLLRSYPKTTIEEALHHGVKR